MTHANRSNAWKIALLAGFITQLLLIVFVTAIGLRQLALTTHNLEQVVDIHMNKQTLTNNMVVAARQRTVLMLVLTRIEDPFERDEMLMQFNKYGAEFAAARQSLLAMPLNDKERELIDLQGQLTRKNQPIQEQVINLIGSFEIEAAEHLAITEAIPGQNKVMDALSALNDETQRVTMIASNKAQNDQKVARFWMYLLSTAGLLLGICVALIVFYYTSRINREREQLATQDVLTGLPNRLLFVDRLEQSLIRARRHKSLVGIMFIDLDRFKRVNDTLGHAGGDQLICEVANRLQAAMREDDIVARLGGDEFVVVTCDMHTVKIILQMVEKILAVVTQPYVIDGREIFISCSIGVSVYPHDGDDPGTLLKNADTAMYHAKNAGRNRLQLYNADMNAMAEERLLLETDLHHALARNEFVFHYQPQLNLDSGRIHGVEALIRWNKPGKGVLAPAEFLELLEETGVIIEVGRVLLLSACQQTANWHAAGFHDMHVAVNVSSKEFWHESLLVNVRDALEQSGLPAQSLQIELTEGIFMVDVTAAVDKIHALKLLGISVSIDDFGTGYSSLAHLKRFPLDVLKIDRYFVRDLPGDKTTEALISSILALCKGLKLGAIAEGVENREQLVAIRKLGCHILQGFLVSQPVPAEQVIALLHHDWRKEFNLN
jgi:diguanylate cyclase (GGDEF)-like protein